MTERTKADERLDAAIDSAALALKDGLTFDDIPKLIRSGVEVAETFDGLTGAEKRDLVQRYVAELVGFALEDSPQLAEWVANLDIPYVPEGVEAVVVDPLIRAVLPPVLRPILLSLVPGVVEAVLDASKGGVQVNTALWIKAAEMADAVYRLQSVEHLLRRALSQTGDADLSQDEVDDATRVLDVILELREN